MPPSKSPTGPRVPTQAKSPITNRQLTEAEQRAVARQTLLAAFQGEMQPVKVPILYRFGIVLSAIVMLLLPLAYLGVIGLAGLAVYYHATQHTGVLQMGSGRGRLMAVLIYVAPIFAGVVLVFFMLKPLFAGPRTPGRTRSLTRQGEPLLFAFVERICEVLGAPMPARIDVDWQLNASAHLDGGWLRLVRNRLVLTIGAPLVANLDAAEFAGVLAHEFGHFTQGVALRMTFLVRSINHWFARVVYQRDSWDEWLEETAQEMDWRVGFVLQLARLSVWLSRRVLWVFMVLGCLVSNFLLRQMEYHADAHEARLVGAKVFEATTRKLAVLSAVYALTLRDLENAIEQGSLPDDLSFRMRLNQIQVPAEAVEAVTRHALEKKTGLFDTHPAEGPCPPRTTRRSRAVRRPAASRLAVQRLPSDVAQHHRRSVPGRVRQPLSAVADASDGREAPGRQGRSSGDRDLSAARPLQGRICVGSSCKTSRRRSKPAFSPESRAPRVTTSAVAGSWLRRFLRSARACCNSDSICESRLRMAARALEAGCIPTIVSLDRRNGLA